MIYVHCLASSQRSLREELIYFFNVLISFTIFFNFARPWCQNNDNGALSKVMYCRDADASPVPARVAMGAS